MGLRACITKISGCHLWILPVFRPFSALVDSPQVGPALRRKPFGLKPAPGLDLGMVSGRENVGNWFALEYRRPGVLRIFEQTVSKTFLGGGSFLAHHAGQEPHAGIEQR